jgi:hypothetical protein
MNSLSIKSMPCVKQLKVIGWSWMLLAGFWLVLFLAVLVSRWLNPDLFTNTDENPWDEILWLIEPTVIVVTLMSGFALLRKWRWSRTAILIVSIVWFGFSLFMIWPERLPPGSVVYGPSPAHGIFSLHLIPTGRHLF